MRIYLVQVNNKVSQEAYKTLEEAQEFVKNRVNELSLIDQNPYYDVVSVKNGSIYHYQITDVVVGL